LQVAMRENAFQGIHAFDLRIHFAPYSHPRFSIIRIFFIFEPLPTVYYNNMILAYSKSQKRSVTEVTILNFTSKLNPLSETVDRFPLSARWWGCGRVVARLLPRSKSPI